MEQQVKAKRFLTRNDLARRWNVSWRTILRMEQGGELPAIHLRDRLTRYAEDAIEEIEARQS